MLRTACYGSLLVLSLLAQGGCHRNCDPIACEFDDEAAFSFYERYDDWPNEQEATYVFEVEFDGRTHTCSGVLGEDIPCDSERVRLRGSSNLTGEDQFRSLDALILDVFPGEATLRITRDGELVFEEPFLIKMVEDSAGNCTVCQYWSQDVDW